MPRENTPPSRAFGTALDLLLLLDMIALFVSGIMMSGFVFQFLHISGGMMIARQLHLFASHWGLILMSAHLGMHIEQFFILFRKLFHTSEKNTARTWVLRMVAIVLSVYGLYAFIAQHITDYLLLQTHFVLFDETKAAVVYFAEIIAMMGLFAAVAHYFNKLLRKLGQKSKKEQSNGRIHKVAAFVVPILVCVLVVIGLSLPLQNEPWQGNSSETPEESSQVTTENTTRPSKPSQTGGQTVSVEDSFVLIKGGSFAMGSPEDEPWRSEDETQHTVTVSDFYMSPYEVRQSEYTAVMGNNPSNFGGNNLPVESVSWLDAIAFCNALSEKENLIPAYMVNGETVTWNRSANGYRLPTEAADGTILRKICARPIEPPCRRIKAASTSVSD